jgi:hypothetical protein
MLTLANDIAGVIVQKPVTSSISKSELINFINNNYLQNKKLE